MDSYKINKLNIFLNEFKLLPSFGSQQGFDPILNLHYSACLMIVLSKLIEGVFQIQKLSGKLRILMDHQLRRISWARPAQAIYYLTKHTPTALYTQRASFNRPIYYYHYAPKNGSILSADFKNVQETVLGLDYAFKNLKIRIHDDRVIFYENDGKVVKFQQGDANFGLNPNYEKQEGVVPLYVREQNPVAIFDKNYFILENGKIVDCMAKRNVDLYLNNRLVENLPIRKLRFSRVVDDSCEVLILFERLFMAQGKLRMKPQDRTNPWEYLFFCDVSEIPGTYGTTDFVCSENFKSFLRTSHLPLAIPKTQRGSRKEERLLKIAIFENLKAVLKQTALSAMHQEKETSTFSNVVCHALWISTSVLEKFEERKVATFRYFTARENLHYIYHKISKSDKKPQQNCGIICKNLENFLNICNRFVQGYITDMQEEIRIEYGYQLLSILDVLQDESLFVKKHDHTRRDIIKSRFLFSNLYSLDAKKLYRVFLEVPSMIKPMIFDILCENAKQSDVNKVLDLYSCEESPNKLGVKESEKLVLNAIRQHPRIVMFGRHPANMKLGLIKALGNFIDNSIKYAGLFVDVESDPCNQEK
ncbi:hypothetical protein CAEBREN_06526 [Caenorhabditis brenneri]|uniref:Uncharacterized protein n=1 Tax=Caenorhabditis brenneri TaxID=135651 RepID=G0N223_CAEBE|nr:hypothetical protein CAEBREN_06526 [Caenorhabditis brenneri]